MARRTQEMRLGFPLEHLKEMDYLEYLDIGVKTNIKIVLEQGLSMRTGVVWPSTECSSVLS